MDAGTKPPNMDVGLLTLGDHLPAPDGSESQTQPQRYRTIVEAAVRAEALGFSSVWVGEHHFCSYIVSSPPVVLASIAERTTNLRLGTAVTLLANLDPVRVAEDYGTLDVLSGGRLELVVGRGILVETYEAFDQTVADSRDAFAEKLELLLRLWTDTGVHWSGRFRSPLAGVTVQPRPLQHPHPPVWVGGGSSPASIELAARLGLPLMLPSVLARAEAFAPMVQHYRECFVRAGHPREHMRVGACSHLHVERDGRSARSRWRPYYANYFGFVDRLWSRRDLIDRRLQVSFDYEALLDGPAICGDPGEVRDRILHMNELLGLDLHLSMMDLGGLPEAEVFATLELFGAEVLPALRAAQRPTSR